MSAALQPVSPLKVARAPGRMPTVARHHLVRGLADHMEAAAYGRRRVAVAAGLHAQTVSKWMTDNAAAAIDTFEAALAPVGLRLEVDRAGPAKVLATSSKRRPLSVEHRDGVHWLVTLVRRETLAGGFSLKDVAEAAGVKRTTVKSWTDPGTRKQPRLNAIEAMLTVLGFRLRLAPLDGGVA